MHMSTYICVYDSLDVSSISYLIFWPNESVSIPAHLELRRKAFKLSAASELQSCCRTAL
jgi:hypothetical protein